MAIATKREGFGRAEADLGGDCPLLHLPALPSVWWPNACEA
jgi:hypothetical protein